jgi:hypothetical protein
MKHVHCNIGSTAGTSPTSVSQRSSTAEHGTQFTSLSYVLIFSAACRASELSFLSNGSRVGRCCAGTSLLEVVHEGLNRAVIKAGLLSRDLRVL